MQAFHTTVRLRSNKNFLAGVSRTIRYCDSTASSPRQDRSSSSGRQSEVFTQRCIYRYIYCTYLQRRTYSRSIRRFTEKDLVRVK